MANARADHGDRVRVLLLTYPEARPDVIAAAVDGDSGQLRYERRV